MDDLLPQLYALAAPPSAFLSQCLGHELQRTRPLAKIVLVALARHLEEQGQGELAGRLRAWCAAPRDRQLLRVEVGYPMAVRARRGSADLLVELRSGPSDTAPVRLLLLAHAGAEAPSAGRLRRACEALRPDAAVLVAREGAGAGLSWGELWRAARRYAPDLAHLLLSAGEVIPWESLAPPELAPAQALAAGEGAAARALAAGLLPWLLAEPGEKAWDRVAAALASHGALGAPASGFGAGFFLEDRLRGAGLRGVSLALGTAPGGKALAWRLEVYPTRRGLLALQQHPDLSWSAIPGDPAGLALDLRAVPLGRSLDEIDLQALVERGRAVLAPLRKKPLSDSAFAPDPDLLAAARGLSIAGLAKGIPRAETLALVLRTAAVHAADAAADGVKGTSVLRRGQGALLAGPRGRVWLTHAPGLDALELCAERGGPDLAARWQAEIDAAEGAAAGLPASVAEAGRAARLRVAVDRDSWRQGLPIVAALARFGRQALGG